MIIKDCLLDSVHFQKNGDLKFTVTIKEPGQDIKSNIHNFISKVINLEMTVNDSLQGEKNKLMSSGQNRLLHKLFRCISESTGYSLDETKDLFKKQYNIESTRLLQKDEATQFIQDVWRWIIANGAVVTDLDTKEIIKYSEECGLTLI